MHSAAVLPPHYFLLVAISFMYKIEKDIHKKKIKDKRKRREVKEGIHLLLLVLFVIKTCRHLALSVVPSPALHQMPSKIQREKNQENKEKEKTKESKRGERMCTGGWKDTDV